MRSLTGSSIPNIDSSDLANYPRGRFKNDSTPTAADGTELSERTLGDLYQAAIELLRRSGITPSETPEKKADSDIADAIGFLKPVMILKGGYNIGTSDINILGGKYLDGYSATLVETSTSGDTTIYSKLTIKKDGVVSTDDFFVVATLANQIESYIGPRHGSSGAPFAGYVFYNDTADNISFIMPGSGAIANTRKSMAAIFTIYKI